ncbi:MAG: twin-arginine translocase TatA/TatE family subunit, partial [Chloroflexi bacterium]|nr:twin-arginine translocase TatA/TatE family subunit [Chloroflexota bacterium]
MNFFGVGNMELIVVLLVALLVLGPARMVDAART